LGLEQFDGCGWPVDLARPVAVVPSLAALDIGTAAYQSLCNFDALTVVALGITVPEPHHGQFDESIRPTSRDH